jgi:hypothetical protein
MVTQPGLRLLRTGDNGPFPIGIIAPVLPGSLAIVSWAIVTSEQAPEDYDADLINRLQRSPGTSADTETEAKTDQALARKIWRTS